MLFHSSLFGIMLSYASAFSGDGTFYGAGGAGQSGACLLHPGFNGVGITVAINVAQFEGGLSCGKCVRITGPNAGMSAKDGRGMTPIVGPIYATVDNVCPECAYGSIDIGLGGDGRWPISWDFVHCNEARNSGSVVPVRVPGRRRHLRGLVVDDEEDVGEAVLLPGLRVTADGLKPGLGVHEGKKERQQRTVEQA